MAQVTTTIPNLEVAPDSLIHERTRFVAPTDTSHEKLSATDDIESPFSLAGYSGSDFDTYLNTSITDAVNAPHGTDHGQYVARLNGLEAGHRYRQEFGIQNIKEHMGVWTAPSEEIHAALLDAKYKRLLSTNGTNALLSDTSESATHPETDTNLLASDFREASAAFAAYTYVKMLAIDRHLRREGQTDATVGEEYNINEATLAKALGLAPEEFSALCTEQRHIVGDHLFITPLHDNELYANMLRREKLFQVHRIADVAGRVWTLDDELTEQFATKKTAAHGQTPEGLQALLAAQQAETDSATAEVDELSGLLSPADAPEHRRAKLHAARTQKEIELRVRRFKFENEYHTRIARLGVEALTTAETVERNRNKRAMIDFAMHTTLAKLPSMSKEAVQALRASIHEAPLREDERMYWLEDGEWHREDDTSFERRSRERTNRGIDHRGDDITNGALIYLEGKIEERLGSIELAQHLCASALGLLSKNYVTPRPREVNPRYTYDIWRSRILPNNQIYSPEELFLKSRSPSPRATAPGQAVA